MSWEKAMFGLDVSLLIGIISSVTGALAWYRSLTRSQYAREREYAHILNALEQNRANMQLILNEADFE
ncbi:hypothetical protein HJG54_07580 [Leptolyngbya sp. NK1-12]|uniref:Uncharacterized protein n=1 Tax=Leptolyngbya sp. NK1-12 TaxID=2547451 RepID=A0AA96WIC4_9CYAN|nr:hypothetical protein [Leptolyngbya sp. NK1-12]WNZ22731.1 hypothetical protein HJG54_07580 [Leptolyngbya sp. NK1-12]